MSNGRATDRTPLLSDSSAPKRSRTANIPATIAKVSGPIGVATRTGVGLATPTPSAPSTALRAIGGAGDAAVGLAAAANTVSTVKALRQGEWNKAIGSATTALGQYGASATGAISRVDPSWAAANNLGRWSAGFTAFAGAATAYSGASKIWSNRSTGNWTWSDLGRTVSGAAIATGATAMAAGFTATAFPALVAAGAGVGLASGLSDWWHGEPVPSPRHDVENPSPQLARNRSFSNLSNHTEPVENTRGRSVARSDSQGRQSRSPSPRSSSPRRHSGTFEEIV